jgi:Tol biopolymer transport system component
MDGGAALTGAGGEAPSITADGRYVAFVSNALNFHPAANGRAQVYVRDRVGDTIELVSQSDDGVIGDARCFTPVITPDGRYVAFSSYAANLAPGDTNDDRDVFVRDRVLHTTERVSLARDGAQVSGGGVGQALMKDLDISDDGRYVVFTSMASSVVPGDTNNAGDVFVRDRSLRTTERVSVGAGGAQGDRESGFGGVAISGNGRYVAFASGATNLVSGDTNNQTDIFVRDRLNGITERVSLAADGSQANEASWEPDLDASGRYIAFTSDAALIPYASLGNVYVRDRIGRSTELVSRTADYPQHDSGYRAAISADGRFVSFASYAGTAGPYNVFLWDRSLNVSEKISVPANGGSANDDSGDHASGVSPNGRFVVYESRASNLMAADRNGRPDVFVRDRTAGTTERASVGSGGAEGITGATSSVGGMSADGRYVVFVSDATNLVPGDTNGAEDAFVWDRLQGVTERVSVSSTGQEAAPAHTPPTTTLLRPAISADGRFVVFMSEASNLVPDDRNERRDVFVRDRQKGTTERASVNTAGSELAFGVDEISSAISADGRFVAFYSSSFELWDPSSTNVYPVQLYVRDRTARTTERVSVSSNGEPADDGPTFADPPGISADGRFVTFESSASNLTPGETPHTENVFVRDRAQGTTELVSTPGSEPQGPRSSYGPSISADGRYVAFTSYLASLVPGDTNGAPDVFVRDRSRRTFERVSVATGGAQAANPPSSLLSATISADGRFVIFGSTASNLAPGDTNEAWDFFVRDLVRRTTNRISLASDGAQTEGLNRFAFGTSAISGDGRYAAFSSGASNLASGDTNESLDVFLRDLSDLIDPPASPTGLKAVSLSATQIQLSWTDASTNETAFKVQRKSGTGAFVEVGAARPDTTSFLDGGLAPNTPYTYRVLAVNANGASAPSPEVPARTLRAPVAPSALDASAFSPTQVKLVWRDNSNEETGFRVEREATDGSWQEIAATRTDSPGYIDGGLTTGRAYTYRVRAVSGTYFTAYTNTATVTLVPAPAAPSGLSATAVSATQMRLAWTDGSTDETGFRLERRVSGGAWTEVWKLPANSTGCLDGNLTPNTLYAYRLRAANGTVFSPYSNTASVTTWAVPVAPGNLKAAAISASQIKLTWADESGTETAYRVERQKADGSWEEIRVLAANATAYVDAGRTAGVASTYRVRASSGTAYSPYSNTASATP